MIISFQGYTVKSLNQVLTSVERENYLNYGILTPRITNSNSRQGYHQSGVYVHLNNGRRKSNEKISVR